MIYRREISVKECYDVAVCGGGFSGWAAACAAAREGAKVILVERNFCLGGVGTQGGVHHILGVRKYSKDGITTCVGGLFAELEERLLQEKSAVDVRTVDPEFHPHGWKTGLGVGLIFDSEVMKRVLEEMLLSAGVKILYMTDIVDVIQSDGHLSALVVHNKNGLYAIGAEAFVDATGDGDLCRFCGCEMLKGDEEGGLAAASLELHVEGVDAEALTDYMRTTGDDRFRGLIEPLKQKGIWTFPYDIFISVMLTRPDVFMINTIRQVGIDGSDADSITRGIVEGRQENFALFEVMKKYFPGFGKAHIRQIAPVLGIRETYRLVGRYTLTVEDLVTGKDFADGIALSGYGWDMPNPKKPSLQPFHGVKRASPYTQIPYGCLLPKQIDDLIAVGRCISVEREALGPVRVMGPCIAMGQAAGIASHEVVEQHLSFGAVDVKKLRNKIIACGGIVDRKGVLNHGN